MTALSLVGLAAAACQPADDGSAHAAGRGETASSAATPTSLPTRTSTFPSAPLPSSTLSPAPPSPTPVVGLRKFGPGQLSIPILLYHHIAPTPTPSRYTVSPEAFEQQLSYLQAAGYHTITMAQFTRAMQVGAWLPDRPIVLTFDDGNLDNYQYALPRLQAHGMVGVLYMVANRIGVEGYLSAEQLLALVAAGWEIGGHTMTHVDLTRLGAERLRVEIHDSRLALQKALGVPVESFAYPFGKVNAIVVQKVVAYGYLSAAGIGISVIHAPDTLYYLDRREVRGSYGLEAFEALLLQPR